MKNAMATAMLFIIDLSMPYTKILRLTMLHRKCWPNYRVLGQHHSGTSISSSGTSNEPPFDALFTFRAVPQQHIVVELTWKQIGDARCRHETDQQRRRAHVRCLGCSGSDGARR